MSLGKARGGGMEEGIKYYIVNVDFAKLQDAQVGKLSVLGRVEEGVK